MSTTVKINMDAPTGKLSLPQIKQHPHDTRIIDEREVDRTGKRHSYQEFKEKLASSLNKRFNADIKV